MVGLGREFWVHAEKPPWGLADGKKMVKGLKYTPEHGPGTQNSLSMGPTECIQAKDIL